MSREIIITDVPDAWVNATTSPDRRDQNYGDTNVVAISSSSGDAGRRGFLKPPLPNIAGETVLDAYAVSHGAPGADGDWSLAAQEIIIGAAADRWREGTITWINQPGIVGSEYSTVISATAADTPVELTGLAPIFQAVADGSDWHGVRVRTTALTAQRFHSTQSGQPAWEFHIIVADDPDPASGLRPDGAAVESSSPILSWDEWDGQSSSRVQVDTPTGGADPDEVAPDYDSGWVANVEPQWSLVSRHTLTGAGPHFFRVNLDTADGLDAPQWSDWAEFTVAAMPSLVVDSPVGAFGDPSPLVVAHLSSGAVKRWDVMVTGATRADVRDYSELQTASTVSYQVPERVGGRRVLKEDEPGEIRIRVWPVGDWATAVGQLPYRETWIPATFDSDLAVAPVTNFRVSRHATGDPRNVWSWEDAEPAAIYLAQVDGVTVARLSLEDLTLVAGRYEWSDYGEIPPLDTHTLGVKRIEDNGGPSSPPATITGWSHTVHGVWLLPEDRTIAPMVFAGTGIGDWFTEDAAATYQTLTGEQVDIIYGTPGRRLTFAGEVFRDGQTDVYGTLRSLRALLKSTNRNARQVWGSESSYGFVRSPSGTPADSILPNNHLHNVRYGFVEVDA